MNQVTFERETEFIVTKKTTLLLMHSHAIDLMYRATSSTPRMLLLLVCYIIFNVFLFSYQLDT